MFLMLKYISIKKINIIVRGNKQTSPLSDVIKNVLLGSWIHFNILQHDSILHRVFQLQHPQYMKSQAGDSGIQFTIEQIYGKQLFKA